MDLNSRLFDRIRVKPRGSRRRRRAAGAGGAAFSRLQERRRVPRAQRAAIARANISASARTTCANTTPPTIISAAWTTNRSPNSARTRRSAIGRPGGWAPRGGARRRPCRRDDLRRSALDAPARRAPQRPETAHEPRYNALGAEGAVVARTRRATRLRRAIKARYKELVKRHHPDANGGDRSSEEKLREIIQAYNYLRVEQAGLNAPAGSRAANCANLLDADRRFAAGRACRYSEFVAPPPGRGGHGGLMKVAPIPIADRNARRARSAGHARLGAQSVFGIDFGHGGARPIRRPTSTCPTSIPTICSIATPRSRFSPASPSIAA